MRLWYSGIRCIVCLLLQLRSMCEAHLCCLTSQTNATSCERTSTAETPEQASIRSLRTEDVHAYSSKSWVHAMRLEVCVLVLLLLLLGQV